MKRTLLLTICLLIAIMTMAQTQQGIVKTRGRMVNGVLQPGVGLQGATVQVKDRSVIVSGANGKFSFPLRTNTYQLESVQKNGYQLVDMEVCRNYQYSANPLYIVMETPQQQLADQLAKEKKLRKDLQKKTQEREDEIDALNISIDEKNRLLQELDQQREDNEKIIKDLSKYYSTLDYDQLDVFQQQVSECLENGEMEKADSLLRSRGDMRSRIASLKAEQDAEEKETEELAQRQKDLDASIAGTRKNMENIAADCYNFHLRFLQAHQNDSAAYYIELRADLDTTNSKWSHAAGNFNLWYMENLSKALFYYKRSLSIELSKGENGQRAVAAIYYNMGRLYGKQHKISESFEYHKKALEIRRKLLGDSATETAASYYRVGTIYEQIMDFPQSLEYFTKALKIAEINSDSGLIADSYFSLGNVYYKKNDLENAWIYYNKSLKYHENGDSLYMTISYGGIAKILVKQNKFSEALDIRHKILNIYH